MMLMAFYPRVAALYSHHKGALLELGIHIELTSNIKAGIKPKSIIYFCRLSQKRNKSILYNMSAQYLAYQDLCEVASHSPSRRQEIFSLSQPGGHPHNWLAISVSCLRLLQGITDQMTDFNNCKLVSGQLGEDKKVASIISAPGSLSALFIAFTSCVWSCSELKYLDDIVVGVGR